MTETETLVYTVAGSYPLEHVSNVLADLIIWLTVPLFGALMSYSLSPILKFLHIYPNTASMYYISYLVSIWCVFFMSTGRARSSNVGHFMMCLDLLGCAMITINPSRILRSLYLLMWICYLYFAVSLENNHFTEVFFPDNTLSFKVMCGFLMLYYVHACTEHNHNFFERMLGMLNVIYVT